MKKPKNKYYGLKYQLPILIGLVVALVITTIGIIGILNSNSQLIILAVIGIALFLVLGFIEKIFMDRSRRICDKCGGSMKGCAYEYQEKNRQYVEGSGNSSGYLKVVVWIRATCPHCGEIKEFTREFKVNGNSDNLQFQVDNFCRKAFRH